MVTSGCVRATSHKAALFEPHMKYAADVLPLVEVAAFLDELAAPTLSRPGPL